MSASPISALGPCLVWTCEVPIHTNASSVYQSHCVWKTPFFGSIHPPWLLPSASLSFPHGNCTSLCGETINKQPSKLCCCLANRAVRNLRQVDEDSAGAVWGSCFVQGGQGGRCVSTLSNNIQTKNRLWRLGCELSKAVASGLSWHVLVLPR